MEAAGGFAVGLSRGNRRSRRPEKAVAGMHVADIAVGI